VRRLATVSRCSRSTGSGIEGALCTRIRDSARTPLAAIGTCATSNDGSWGPRPIARKRGRGRERHAMLSAVDRGTTRRTPYGPIAASSYRPAATTMAAGPAGSEPRWSSWRARHVTPDQMRRPWIKHSSTALAIASSAQPNPPSPYDETQPKVHRRLRMIAMIPDKARSTKLPQARVTVLERTSLVAPAGRP